MSGMQKKTNRANLLSCLKKKMAPAEIGMKRRASILAQLAIRKKKQLKVSRKRLFAPSIPCKKRTSPMDRKNQQTGSLSTSTLLSMNTGMSAKISVPNRTNGSFTKRFKRRKIGNNVKTPKKSDTIFPAISQLWTMAYAPAMKKGSTEI